ncbi:doublesex- and mab-3-related transcription factor C1-like [Puma concolor]|uniref:Doublesex- and mab-3-related transcription factor C1-like n=1 Tax=Puma concolor TaxID=9696 RepID=A0A6P6IRW6_PUMCO|nr:doublesex- and mab-3-related transcription factor C1-like [Puma concolor]
MWRSSDMELSIRTELGVRLKPGFYLLTEKAEVFRQMVDYNVSWGGCPCVYLAWILQGLGFEQLCLSSNLASTQGGLLIGQAPKSLSLSWTPAALKMQLTTSLSRKTHRTPALSSICSTLVLQPCATLDPVLIPLQGPEASDQDSVSASSEWQRKLEAAEALLMLRNSSQTSSGSISLLQPCVAAAPAGDEGPQPSSSSLRPRPASSVSLPIGHLGFISLLS